MSKIVQGSPQHRARIILNARRLRANIQGIFDDCDHWNRLHPHEKPVDPDEDGQLRRLLDGLTFMLACEDANPGVGRIEPIDSGIADSEVERTKQ